MTSNLSRRLAWLGVASGSSALALWTTILVREWPRLMAAGTICGEQADGFGHCPACYPAAALTVVAFMAAGCAIGVMGRGKTVTA